MTTPESAARRRIDAALLQAGWVVQDAGAVNLAAGRGVAIREFPLMRGLSADYLLYVEGGAVGVIEAKAEGTPLTGVELQAEMYSSRLPPHLPAPVRPLPFLYQSTGVETRFTNRLDPEPRSRPVFHFHRPETAVEWLAEIRPADQIGTSGSRRAAEAAPAYDRPPTLRGRFQTLPPLDDRGLWPAQAKAVQNLELSFRRDHPRALIQMATGSGKTFTAIAAIYRLIKFGGARRVVFLVDRANLGRQALKEFQQFTTPGDGRKFNELYNVQHLTTNRIDPVARVCITTIQRLFSMLRGDPDLDPALEERSTWDAPSLIFEPAPVIYNPGIPIETFDVIFTDECHRSIYNLWRQVLEYFDAHLVGLTATPSKQTFGFFNQNLVMEYNHEQAVADGVNVDFDVYRIRTKISELGSTVEAGLWVDKRDRASRAVRWEQLDDDLTYDAKALDRDVVALDQIRTVIETFRDRLYSEIFPGRTEVPKTLIYAKDDSHADDIVQIVREVFGRGNDFCEKITYRTGTARLVTRETGTDGREREVVTYKATGVRTDDRLQAFRTAYFPRIVVTVDMIATGTDIKPLEVVMFLRAVKSRNYFDQMKGRGVRIIDDTSFQAVTPDARSKTRFVIVDCVGVCEQDLIDVPSLEKQPSVSLDKLLQAVAFGSLDREVLSTLAGRLARLDRALEPAEREALVEATGGLGLNDLARGLVDALDPDRQIEAARQAAGLPEDADPTAEQVAQAARDLLRAAVAPIATSAALRDRLIDLKRRSEQVIDTVSQDAVLSAGYSEAAREKAQALVSSFEEFIQIHRDEITALQVLYSRPYAQRLRLADIKALAEAIQQPPRAWTPDALWEAYQSLDRSRVRGSGHRVLTDLVSLVRFAIHQEDELVPFPERVAARFETWLNDQETSGRRFTPDQREWLDLIWHQIAGSLSIEVEDFNYGPLRQRGGLGGVHRDFGPGIEALLEELNRVLAA